MEIKIENVRAAYENADAAGKELLSHLFGSEVIAEIEKPRPVTERIKTFEDAYEALGSENPLVKHFDKITNIEGSIGEHMAFRDLRAFLKLRIIAAALNEGWQPSISKDEPRWEVWYSFEDWDSLSEYGKSRVVGRASYNANAVGGCVYADAFFASSNSYTRLGARLAFKSEELAKYAGKQFAPLWADFFFAEDAQKIDFNNITNE